MHIIVRYATGIKLEIDMRDVTEAGTAAMDTSELSAGYYFIWMLGPNMVPSLAQQNRIQAVDDYFLGTRISTCDFAVSVTQYTHRTSTSTSAHV